MVNWKDPEVELQTGRALVILMHCAFAVYAYEFFHWMGHDKIYLLGRRKMGVGSFLYLGTRYFGLISLALCVRFVNVFDDSFNCRNLFYILRAFAFSTVACTSGLLYLRVVALSKENRWIAVLFGFGYAGVWAFVGVSVYETNAVYFAPLFTCAPVGTHKYAPNTIYPFVYDTSCLVMMIFFLIRMKYGGKLWTFLIQQGLIYACVICSAYLFAVLLISLELNDPMGDIGLVVILTAATIFGTRMQRDLEDFFDRPVTEVTGRSTGTTAVLSTPVFKVPAASCPNCGGQGDGSGNGAPCGHPGCTGRNHFSGSNARHYASQNPGSSDGVQVSVQVDIEESDPGDWKGTSNALVADDYEMGRIERADVEHKWDSRRMI